MGHSRAHPVEVVTVLCLAAGLAALPPVHAGARASAWKGWGIKSAAGQQRLEMLEHWDLTFPNGDQFPATGADFQFDATQAKTYDYNPLVGTADGARTWTPNYPDQYVYRFVKVNLEPVCNWQFDKLTGYWKKRNECETTDRTDVRVKMHIKYENQYGKRTSGLRCIGDAPDESEAPNVWDGERDKIPNLRPFIISVKDKDDVDLEWTMHRSGDHWWLDYVFAQPVEGRMYYEVDIEYQLQRVMQGSPSKNTFSAPWLVDWSAPVKEMEVVWTFPPEFTVASFDVTPHNQAGEGRKGGSDGEMRRVTRACCGNAVTKHVEDMERCTAANNMDSVWDDLKGNCEGKTVMLSTLISLPETMKQDGTYDEHALKGVTEYQVSFSPGLVDDPWTPAVGERYAWGVPWWGWIVLGVACVPIIAAVFYTLARYGAMDFFLDQSAYKQRLQRKV